MFCDALFGIFKLSFHQEITFKLLWDIATTTWSICSIHIPPISLCYAIY
jgi:hypothetical protein